MPYKSDAQRRFFHAAAERGEVPKSVVREYDRESRGKKLPEKAGEGNPDSNTGGEDKRRRDIRKTVEKLRRKGKPKETEEKRGKQGKKKKRKREGSTEDFVPSVFPTAVSGPN